MDENRLLAAIGVMLDEKLLPIRNSVDDLTERVDVLTGRMDVLTERMDVLTEQVDELKEQSNRIEKRVTILELTLENETNRNIKVIAEGHSILDGKLDMALQAEKRSELTQMRLNINESDIKKIKYQLQMA